MLYLTGYDGIPVESMIQGLDINSEGTTIMYNENQHLLLQEVNNHQTPYSVNYESQISPNHAENGQNGHYESQISPNHAENGQNGHYESQISPNHAGNSQNGSGRGSTSHLVATPSPYTIVNNSTPLQTRPQPRPQRNLPSPPQAPNDNTGQVAAWFDTDL